MGKSNGNQRLLSFLETSKMLRRKLPVWLASLMVLSYFLLLGCGLVVLLGGAYCLFFAPLETMDPSSLNTSTPLWQKIAYLALIVAFLVIGYMANRFVWGRFRDHFAEEAKVDEEDREQEDKRRKRGHH